MLETPYSFLRRLFPDDGSALTHAELSAHAKDLLPPATPPHIGPEPDALAVHTEWAGPHAEEIRAQLAAGRSIQTGGGVSACADHRVLGLRPVPAPFYARKLGYSGIQGLLVLLQYCGAFGALLFLYRETRDLSQLLLLVLVLGQLNRPFEVIGTSLRDFAVAKSMAEPMIDLLNDHPPVTRNCMELVEAYTDPDRPPVIEIESLTQGYSDSAPPVLDGITTVFVRDA
jgi:ABC-type multidrug transport system fused ATPase/permease subunit